MIKPKVLLLNSGGADSIASAIILRKGGYDVSHLFIDYGQSNVDAEYDSAYEFAKNSNEKFYDEDLKFYSKMTGQESKDQEVYLRNFVFMSYACQVAYSTDIQSIATGYLFFAEAVDYIDDDPKFLQQFHALVNQNFGMRLVTPLAGYDKEMVYHTLLDEGIHPVELPYCNTPKTVDGSITVPCGTCHKCRFTNEFIKYVNESRETK
jgi:7-cyano-7-deazaguanine synthase in queuosine biosynthesis